MSPRQRDPRVLIGAAFVAVLAAFAAAVIVVLLARSVLGA
jgi:hypothetical protein